MQLYIALFPYGTGPLDDVLNDWQLFIAQPAQNQSSSYWS